MQVRFLVTNGADVRARAFGPFFKVRNSTCMWSHPGCRCAKPTLKPHVRSCGQLLSSADVLVHVWACGKGTAGVD